MQDARGFIGNYVLERELGRGGMGLVYAARHRVLGHRAAIKVLLGADEGDHSRVERFFNEARAATSIRHPGIVHVHDVGLDVQNRPYIAMELLEGTSLGQILAAGPLPIRVAIDYALQIADALAAAHAAGVIHRDLKPENIMVSPDRARVTIVDFGVARLVHAANVRTATGAIVGTPLYMSPEQCEGLRELDARSDLYSLGCVLFAMLTGRPPFDAASAGALIGLHQHVAAPSLRSRVPACSEALDRVVAILLAKSPDSRFRSARAVHAALDTPEVKTMASSAGVAATMDIGPARSGTSQLPTPLAQPHPPTIPTQASPPDPVHHGAAPQVPAHHGTPAPVARPRGSRRWLAVLVTGLAGIAVVIALLARCGGGETRPPVDAAVAVVSSDASATSDAVLGVDAVVNVAVVEPDAGSASRDWGAVFASTPDAAPPPKSTSRGPANRKPPEPEAVRPAPPDAAVVAVAPAPPDAAVVAVAPPPPDAAPPAPDAPPKRKTHRERLLYAANDFESRNHADAIERVAAAYAAGATITIVGYAEENENQRPQGTASARANSILTALTTHRIPRDAIHSRGEVVAPTSDGSGRRVDIRVD